MKTVYIELFFLDNILINFYFLYLSGAILRLKINYKTGLTAAFLGALYGFFQISGWTFLNLFICKLALSLAMVFLSYPAYKTYFIKLLFAFYALSFAFAGLILGIFYATNKDSFLRSAFAIPIPLRIALLIFLIGHFAKKYLLSIISLLTYCKQGISLYLSCFSSPIALTCYSDTGNTCTYFGKPVIFVNKGKLNNNVEEKNILNGNICQGQNNINIIYIPYKTAGGNIMTAPGFRCENALISRGEMSKEMCVYIALLDHDFSGEPSLINPALLD